MNEHDSAPVFWIISPRGPAMGDLSIQHEEGSGLGLTNDAEIQAERYRQWDERGETPPYLEDLRYEYFNVPPRYVSPSTFVPDYVTRGRTLVSPKLFGLLDQPRGSLQGWPTDTVWLGDNPPDWEYLWLCYVPSVPAIDPERSDVTVDFWEKDGVKVPRIGQRRALRLLHGLSSPFGVFRAAEGGSVLLASDAVAQAVVRAGCTGIEFLDPATAFVMDGVRICRGRDGPEPRAPESDYPDSYTPRPWDDGLPLVGPLLVWDESPVNWLDWEPADTELQVPVASPESGDAGNVLARFLQNSIYFDDAVAAEVLEAIADVQEGRSDLWVSDLPVWILVLRPDAAWLRHEDAVQGYGPFAYPLDGMAAAVERWRESIKLAPDPNS